MYATRADAERDLGKCYPAPLGDVVKHGPDGAVKHRLIQDLRRNGLNAVAGIPERQVLPRFVDHAVDLAKASRSGEWEAFVVDFENAYMSVAASRAEARFNCCISETPIERKRPPIDKLEPAAGTFIMWLVLGFGGKSYPLLYARVALVSRSCAPPPTVLVG